MIVDVPPLTLKPWNQMDLIDSFANLLSPQKGLLSAAPNPLNPRTSPFFTSKRNMVVAPHPSELPLPSMNLAPKRIMLPDEQESPKSHHENVESMKLANSLEDASLTDSENYSTSENETVERVSTTPSKRREFRRHCGCVLESRTSQLYVVLFVTVHY